MRSEWNLNGEKHCIEHQRRNQERMEKKLKSTIDKTKIVSVTVEQWEKDERLEEKIMRTSSDRSIDDDNIFFILHHYKMIENIQ